MLKNKKLKNVIHVFTFLLVFFICGNNVYADNPVKCVYTSSDGTAQVNVEIKTNGDATKAHYVKWGGYERNNKESVGNYEDDYWDTWIYENKKCPPKLLASYEIVELWEDNHATPYFEGSNQNFYYADNAKDWVLKNQKILTLNESLSIYNFSSVSNPRQVTTLYSQWSDGDTYNSTTADSYGYEGDVSRATLEVGEKGILYIKGQQDSFAYNTVKDFGTDLTCTVSDTDVLSIGSKQNISMKSGYNANLVRPGYYYVVTAKKPTGTDAKIKCSYRENGTLIKEFTWDVQVTGTASTTETYKEAHVQCLYTAKYKDDDGNTYNISDLKIYTTNYNDNAGSVSGDNQIGTSFYYKNTSGQWIEVNKGEAITYYQHSGLTQNKNKKLKYDFTRDNYEKQLKNNHGSCPPLYIKKSGNTYLIQLTKANDNAVAVDNTSRTSYDSNGNINDTQSFDPADIETYSIPFIMYDASCESMGNYHIKFSMNGSNLQYVITKGGSEITTKKTVTNLYQDLVTDNIGNYSYTGYSYIYHKVKVKQVLLSQIKSHLTSGTSITSDIKKLTDDVTTTDYSGNITTNRYYTLSSSNITPSGTAMDSSKCAQTNGSGVEGTEEDDGTQNPSGGSGPSGLGGLNIGSSGSKQTPEEFCESLLGEPSSRNGVGKIVESILTLIRIGVPILLIITSMVDFTKATGNDDEMVKAKKNAITRFIVAVAVLFAPSLVNLVLGLLDWKSCAIF